MHVLADTILSLKKAYTTGKSFNKQVNRDLNYDKACQQKYHAEYCNQKVKITAAM